jgi:hypothetical protein
MRDSLGEVDRYGRGNEQDADTLGNSRRFTPSRRSEQFADYYPLIAQAVDRLKQSTAAARKVIYDRARSAMTAQLRNVTPPLTESVISREQLALEKAIRKVETESLRASRTPLEPSIRQPYPAPIRKGDDEQSGPPRSKIDEEWVADDLAFGKTIPISNPDRASELEHLQRQIRRGGPELVILSARTLVPLAIMGLLIISVAASGAH